MNRRHFLAASAAATTLAAAQTASAKAPSQVKVLIPTTPPAQLAELEAAGAGIELVQSPGTDRRRHELFRENLGRFARGEMLVNIVDKKVGY